MVQPIQQRRAMASEAMDGVLEVGVGGAPAGAGEVSAGDAAMDGALVAGEVDIAAEIEVEVANTINFCPPLFFNMGAAADRCLQILVSHSEAAGSTLGDLQERIKWHRFEAYNRQWVRMTSSGDHWADDLEAPQSLRQMMHASMLSMQDDLTGPSSRNWRNLLDQRDDLDVDMMGYHSFSPSQDYYMNNLEWASRWS